MDLRNFTSKFEKFIKNYDFNECHNFGIVSGSKKVEFFAQLLCTHQNLNPLVIDCMLYASENEGKKHALNFIDTVASMIENAPNLKNIILLKNFDAFDDSQTVYLQELFSQGFKHNNGLHVPLFVLSSQAPQHLLNQYISFSYSLDYYDLEYNKLITRMYDNHNDNQLHTSLGLKM